MMEQRATKGVRGHVKQINALWKALRRRKVICQYGWKETPEGYLPPPPNAYLPQFSPLVAYDADSDVVNLSFARGGYCYMPYHDSTDSPQIPAYRHVPFIPVMGSPQYPIIGGDESPVLALPVNETSVVYLKIPWTARDEEIGGTDYSGTYMIKGLVSDKSVSGQTGTEPDHSHTISSDGDHGHSGLVPTDGAHNHSGYTGDNGEHYHSLTGTFDGTVLIRLMERNYAYDGEDDIEIVSEPIGDWISRGEDQGEEETHLPMGKYSIDPDGIVTHAHWYVEGPIYVPARQPHVWSDETGTPRPVPTTGDPAGDYETPGEDAS